MNGAAPPLKHVLVTNDDGVGARGLREAARAVLRAGYVPTVVAPAADRSSMSMALGHFNDVWFHREPESWSADGSSAVPVYRFDGYPSVLVTMAAAGGFGPRPDLVLVGINHGTNSGIGVVHSATVGAALTAGMAGIPALAVSVAGPEAQRAWPRCTALVSTLVTVLAGAEPQVAGALNVNLPPCPPPDPKCVAWRSPAVFGPTVGRLEREELAGGVLRMRMRFEPLPQLPAATSDTGALLRGEVALTWIPLPHGVSPSAEWQESFLTGVRDLWAVELW